MSEQDAMRRRLAESEASAAAMSAELSSCCDARWDIVCGGPVEGNKPCQFYDAENALLRERLERAERERDELYRVALSEMSAFTIQERLDAVREGRSDG